MYNNIEDTSLIVRDQGIKKVLGVKDVTKNARGDVVILNKNGTATYIEIVSERSQTERMLRNKVDDLSKDLERRGVNHGIKYEVWMPEKVFNEYPELVTKYLPKR